MVRRVMIVDEHPLGRRGLRSVLQERFADLEILDVASLDLAINLLAEKSPIDMGIFALPLPGLSGPEALRDVVDNYPVTRFVVLSSSKSRNDIVAALSAGLHGFIVKSQPEEDIASAVSDILAGRIYVPSIMSEITSTHELDQPLQRFLGERHHDVDHEIACLTPRQLEVMILLAEGISNKEIARDLHIAEATAKIHVAAIMRTLGARNRTEAAVLISSRHKI
jgi:DNA-binding NarL/FixJ family response regulator